MTSHIELRGVSKRFGGATAVHRLSLAVRKGELVSLLGPSGCGKTTTLNLVAGFLEPDEGEIVIDGMPVQGLPPYRRNLGMVFQNFALFPHLTVFDNVAFGLRMRRVPSGEIAQRVREALDLVELTGFEQRYRSELSGGQCQRVALARALVVRPTALLLDEPFSSLDAGLREQLRVEVREIQRRVNITTLFVTHDQSEALAMSDHIVVMNHGHIEQVGTPAQVYHESANEFVARFVGQTNLFRGRVVEAVDGDITLMAGPLRLRARGGGRGEGGDVMVGVRPEAILIDPPADTENQFVARLVHQTFLGATTHCMVEVDGIRLRLQFQNHAACAADGSTLRIGWSAASTHVIGP
jgi:ABC-type Fe3+/spermidine/putrescine transport system ATPase subunit